MQKDILASIEAEGIRVRAVSAEHLGEIKAEFDRLRDEGTLPEAIKPYLEHFRWDGAPDGMRTVLATATPSKIGVAAFRVKGRELAARIPPTYMDYRRVPAAVEEKLNGILGRFGYRAKLENRLPGKLMAVRSGLGEYGRNNICYVPGLGSFALLNTYYTDMPCEEDGWRDARRMDLCRSCKRCEENCPTGAILPDRAVIDASRCVTLHNEMDSGVPFPPWIGPAAHNSLVGCMRCQAVCPVNRDVLSMVASPVEFDEAETELLLAGALQDSLPAAMAEKMDRLNMNGFYETITRNLKTLLGG